MNSDKKNSTFDSSELVVQGENAPQIAPDASANILSVIERWESAFNRKSVSEIVMLFSARALFKGLSPNIYAGAEEIRAYYSGVPVGVTVKVDPTTIRANALDQENIVGFVGLVFIGHGDDIPVSLSLALHRENGVWVIFQYHASVLQ